VLLLVVMALLVPSALARVRGEEGGSVAVVGAAERKKDVIYFTTSFAAAIDALDATASVAGAAAAGG
jgi:hypothetical protein